MKDSGVEWIGQIPSDWKCCKQKYLITLLNGRAYKDSEFEEDGKYKILRVGNLFTNPVWYSSSLELEPNKYCQDGDLLYSWSMSYAPVIWHGEKVIYHYHIWKTVLSEKISKMFAYYYLISLTNALQAEIHETTMGFITMGVMNNAYIAFPPLAEQQRIADFLDEKCGEIDSIRSDIQKQIDILNDYKKSVITEAVTKGLNPKAKLKDSGIEWIGKIPEGWSIKKIKFLLSNETDSLKVGPFGSQLSGTDLVSDGFWVYSQRVVLDRNFENNTMFISKEKFDSMKGFHVRTDDILITTRGSIGKICKVPESFSEGVLHPCVIKFRIDQNKYSYKFLEFIFNDSGIVEKQLNYLSNSTTIEVIYSGTLKNLQVPYPPLSEQKAIADYLDEKCSEIDATIADKQRQLETLDEYKKSLIFEYVTGKKEVLQ